MFNEKYRLTQAVLEGRKTQTRRIIPENLFQECRSNGLLEAGGFNSQWKENTLELLLAHSTYKIGGEVAVAQSYKDAGISADGYVLVKWVRNRDGSYDDCYKKAKFMKGWDNKMFVRAHLMPHRIRITNVRVERLQNISEEDCLKEGIVLKNGRYIVETYKGVTFYTTDARLAFKYLIDKTCGRGTWDSNPYVFVYDFKLVK